MDYNNITKESIEEAIKEAFSKRPKEREIKIVCLQGGYDLFCEALEKQALKYIISKEKK